MDRAKVKPPVDDGTFQITESHKFWGHPDRFWPRPFAACEFLADAVHVVGEAKFGAGWTYDEPVTAVPRAIPTGMLSQYDKYRVRRVLEGNSPDSDWKLKDDQEKLRLANSILEAKAAIAKPKAQRFWDVIETIGTACVEGKLTSVVRGVQGGEMRELLPEAWNTDRLWFRFQFCQYDPSDPFGARYKAGEQSKGGSAHMLLFIERTTLDAFADQLRDPSRSLSAVDLDLHLSPYIHTMVGVSKELDTRPNKRLLKKTIENSLIERWRSSGNEKKFGKLSLKLLGAMATLIREPKSQIGGHVNSKKTGGGWPPLFVFIQLVISRVRV